MCLTQCRYFDHRHRRRLHHYFFSLVLSDGRFIFFEECVRMCDDQMENKYK